MDHETGLVFFISAIVLVVAGLVMVSGRRVSMRYLVYRVVPLSGFFGAFGLSILTNPSMSVGTQVFFAAVQTAFVMVLLHVFIGRHLRG